MNIPPTAEESLNYDAGITAYNRGHFEVAMYDFERRAMNGEAVAQFCLGYMYKHGKGVKPDSEKAIAWYIGAAERGYTPAQNDLGVMYMRLWEETEFLERKSGRTDLELVMKSYFDASIRWFQEAAKQDNPTAQFNLASGGALMARHSSQEPGESIKWSQPALISYKKAAKQDYAPAQNELGKIYQFGLLAVDRDSEQALQLYLKAASPDLNAVDSGKKGYAPAQQNIGTMYLVGDGIKKDPKEAFKWYQMASAQGNAESQFHLGLLYYNGEGVNHDVKEAFKWYQMASAQGHPAAQNALARMYLEGEEVPENPEMAGRLFFTSAQQGNAVAEVNIGMAFENGMDGIPQDFAEAYYWYNLALKIKTGLDQVETGNIVPEVSKALKRVGNRLSESQRKEIQKQVDNWDPKHRAPSGTGFYISKNYILTNAHVVDSCDELRTPYRRVTVIAVDEKVDLALLFDPRGNTDTAVFRRSPVNFGEDIAVFGYPMSSVLSYRGNSTFGKVSGLSSTIDDTHPHNLFQYTAPTQGGNSGGPILDAAGNVVGVVVSGLDPTLVRKNGEIEIADVQNVNFAIKFNIIEDFLQRNNVTSYVVTEDSSIPIEPREIPIKTEKFTVPVLRFVNQELPLPLEEIGIEGLER